MPIFLPIRPVIVLYPSAPTTRLYRNSLKLDLHIHAGGDIQLAQSVNGLLCRLENVEQPFVRANLVLIACFLIDVRRAVDRESFDSRGQRYGTRHATAGAPHGLNDFAHRLVEHAVVVGFQPNSNFLVHTSSSDLPSNFAIIPSATVAGTGS